MRGNEVKIEGFIGKTIKTNDDKTYVSFSLSVKKQEKKYNYFDCKGFKDVSKNFDLKASDLVVVEGHLDIEEYKNKDGVEVKKPVIIVEKVYKKYDDDVPY